MDVESNETALGISGRVEMTHLGKLESRFALRLIDGNLPSRLTVSLRYILRFSVELIVGEGNSDFRGSRRDARTQAVVDFFIRGQFPFLLSCPSWTL